MKINIVHKARRKPKQYPVFVTLAVRGDEWRKHIKPFIENSRLEYEELHNKELGTYYRARVNALTENALLTNGGTTSDILVDVVLFPEGDLSKFNEAQYIVFQLRCNEKGCIELWFRPVDSEREEYFVLVSINTLKSIIRDLFVFIDLTQILE